MTEQLQGSPGGSGQEIELKLAMTPEALAKLRRHPLLRSLAGSRRSRKVELQSTYFDTPGQALRKAGLALRVRHDGRRHLQTLKAPILGESGFLQVREFETEVADDKPDLTLIDDEAVRGYLDQQVGAGSLQPLFTTRVTRRLLPIRLLDSEIEVAFDEGEILDGLATETARRETLTEAEFELKSGRPERLYQLALTLHEQVPFRLERRSKAARGYALALGEEPQPSVAERVQLAADATAGEAFLAVLRSCLQQMRANEVALLAGCPDPEAVHQMRVGVRRLRAAVTLFQPLLTGETEDYLRGELTWLQRALGPARDSDVFFLELLEPLAHRLPDESGLARLRGAVERLRREERQVTEAALHDRRYTALLLRLYLWLDDGGWRLPGTGGPAAADQPADGFAEEALAKRVRQLIKRGKRATEDDFAALHRLRIAAKKLRYALEFFRDLVKKSRGREALGALKELQDCLGSLNDAVVSRRLLADVVRREPDALDPRSEGLVLGWQAARIDADLARLHGAWKHGKRALRQLLPG